MERVIAYVDGFDLYFGLKSKGWRRYYWLNIQTLAQNLLKANPWNFERRVDSIVVAVNIPLNLDYPLPFRWLTGTQ